MGSIERATITGLASSSVAAGLCAGRRRAQRPAATSERAESGCPRRGTPRWLLVGGRTLNNLVLLILVGCGGNNSRLIDLWLTPDQQGQRAMDRGDYAESATRFEDPLRKGTAYYLEQDFSSALGEFAKLDTAEGWFNRGNSLAHLERYEEAMEAYRQALELQPDFPRAEANLEYMEPFLPLEFEGGEMGTVGRDAAADDVVFDADQDRLNEEGIDTVTEGGEQMLTDEQLAELWLRQVDTSPTSFLRYKFAYQAQMGAATEGTAEATGDGQ